MFQGLFRPRARHRADKVHDGTVGPRPAPSSPKLEPLNWSSRRVGADSRPVRQEVGPYGSAIPSVILTDECYRCRCLDRHTRRA